MKQGIFKIKENEKMSDIFWKMVLEGDCSALTRPGQFVDVALDGKFLRRPFAAQKWSEREMTVIYRVVGDGTDSMSKMTQDQTLDILTGLGNGFDCNACKSKALIVTGGLGASPVFSLADELRRRGKEVEVIMGFNKASDIVLADEFRSLGATVKIATLDGSEGTKGLVTDIIRKEKPTCDYFYTCGPKVMMRAVCEMLEVPGEASLEERMGCGCGICYGCTCHTNKGPKRICADGPVFKKEDIIW